MKDRHGYELKNGDTVSISNRAAKKAEIAWENSYGKVIDGKYNSEQLITVETPVGNYDFHAKSLVFLYNLHDLSLV